MSYDFTSSPLPVLLGLGAAVLGMALLLVRIALSDLRRRVIPNTDVAALVLAGVVFCFLAVPQELAFRIAGAVLSLTAGLLLSIGAARVLGKEALGMGDVKLFAAATLWVGPHNLAWILVISSASALAAVFFGVHRPDAHIPFGLYLCPAIALFAGIELWRAVP